MPKFQVKDLMWLLKKGCKFVVERCLSCLGANEPRLFLLLGSRRMTLEQNFKNLIDSALSVLNPR
jgi:hypothetical protein